MSIIFNEAVNSSLNTVKDALKDIDPGNIDEIVNTIVSASSIFVYGAGRSGIIGRTFAMRLVQIGLRSYFIGESITPIVSKNDCTLILSNKGESFTSIQVGNIAKRVGANVIVVTSNTNTKLSHLANTLIVLNIHSPGSKYLPLGTSFEESALILLDAIIAELMFKLGENEESMRRRHAIMI